MNLCCCCLGSRIFIWRICQLETKTVRKLSERKENLKTIKQFYICTILYFFIFKKNTEGITHTEPTEVDLLTHSGEADSDGRSLADMFKHLGLAILSNVVSHLKVPECSCIVQKKKNTTLMPTARTSKTFFKCICSLCVQSLCTHVWESLNTKTWFDHHILQGKVLYKWIGPLLFTSAVALNTKYTLNHHKVKKRYLKTNQNNLLKQEVLGYLGLSLFRIKL